MFKSAVTEYMPFPLAHPAAVLPLRRYCPKFFSFPALVLGAIAPDLGYFFGKSGVDELSHQLVGSVVFCLPIGLILLVLFYKFRSPFIRVLPAPYQRVIRPLGLRPASPFLTNCLSLLMGSWTHLAWDSFTHQDGWLVAHLSILNVPLGFVAGHKVKVCHLLWYACSFIGVIIVCFSFMRSQKLAAGRISTASAKADFAVSVLIALSLLPIELVHHLIVGGLGLVLAGGATMLLLLVLAWGIGRGLPECA